MQREIKRKSIAYGIMGVLLAVLLGVATYNLGVPPLTWSGVSQLKTFSSYGELEHFLKTNMEQATAYQAQEIFPFFRASEAGTILSEGAKAAPAHSTTNIQVAGVDEADIVKTDGEYLYVVSKSNIYIIRAYPPDQATVLSKITLNETYSAEVYVKGDKIAVLGEQYDFGYIERMPSYVYPSGETFIKVYDISDRASPILKRTVRLNGTFSGSRMIGNYVYAVVNQPAIGAGSNETTLKVDLPTIVTEVGVRVIQPTEIRYANVSDVFYYFTTVVAVNILNDAREPTYSPFLTGSTANMYVSQSNMYLTVPNTNVWIGFLGSIVPMEETLIYRVRLDSDRIVLEAQGNVSGYVLNQFSMDEYGGFFRIATTTGWGESSVNNLYVLDMSLNIVGRLEGLAREERIYSARFMGDRCYLVTFRQVDPFFVIDLSIPPEPKVLGYLKIPGFSGYLHPYDEEHVIGVGREDNAVKLSLYDVTNVTTPTEKAKFIVQGGWSDSTALSDHKAFLFDRSKRLLALPISINWFLMTEETYYTKGYWQGEYVFDISLSSGFVLRGNVTHQESDTDPWDSNYLVKRALYIDNVLYTVSGKKVTLNSLEDLGLIKEIRLN